MASPERIPLGSDSPENARERVKRRVAEKRGHVEDTVRAISNVLEMKLDTLRADRDAERLLDAAGDTDAARTLAGAREALQDDAERVSLADLHAWLKEHGLDATFTSAVRASRDAFLAGPYGFALKVDALRFPKAQLPSLLDALQRGAVNGAVITAYPDREELADIAAQTGETVEALLDLPVTEFLVRHFEGRGGKLYDRDRRLAEWGTLRWKPDGAPVLPKDYNTLPPQPRLRDVLGQARLGFTNVTQDVDAATPLLEQSGDPKHPLRQGKGLSHAALARAGVSTPTPDEWLALAALTRDPGNPSTYPSAETWEWINGVTPSSAASGDSDSGGLYLIWDPPGGSNSDGRARSVVR